MIKKINSVLDQKHVICLENKLTFSAHNNKPGKTKQTNKQTCLSRITVRGQGEKFLV